MKGEPSIDPWARLRAATSARIGLGRAGDAMPLGDVLAFQLAHAKARDAVHTRLDLAPIAAAFPGAVEVRSCAESREIYLRRPDLGRQLHPDCAAMLRIDRATGLVVSHTPAPRKRMFEDLESAAQAMRDQNERKESIFRQSVDAEKNKADLLEKKFAEALRKAKDAPEGKPLREFDLD